MFRQIVTPPVLSLFSSVGNAPLHTLWHHQTDQQLPGDSFICLVEDACTQTREEDIISQRQSTSSEAPKMISLPQDYEGGYGKVLNTPVLHIQSPTIPSTFIICPPSGELGLSHQWIHLQIRNLQKECSFEVGVVDASNRKGRIRWSTFQQLPRVTLPNTPRLLQQGMNSETTTSTSGPILHLPLSFPDPSSRPLTGWCTLDINVATILPKFQTVAAASLPDDEDNNSVAARLRTANIPSGPFSQISYVKIYANCRLRRVWLSQGANQNAHTTGLSSRSRTEDEWPEEFRLYSSTEL